MSSKYMSFPVHLTEYDMRIDKDAWIEDIIDYVRHMEIDDDILVYDFGKNGDLKLTITMDDDTDIRIFVDMLSDSKNDNDSIIVNVDETDWFYKSEIIGIRNELRRIWNKDYTID